MLDILEKVGKYLQPKDLEDHLVKIPKSVRNDKEKVVRFLLLTAILDQQAKSPTARSTAVRIFEIFGSDLFDNPLKVQKNLKRLESIKSSYKISPAVGRVLPRFAWFVLRVGGFLTFELMLNESLVDKLGTCASSSEAAKRLSENPVIESILREKACRMFISWIGHPELGINISNDNWSKLEFLMPVDGHVGKVFCRTGMITKVIHEGKINSSKRWNIIVASKMRDSVQQLVQSYNKDTIMVDHGAFQLGLNCCPDNLNGICCDACSKLTCKVSQNLTVDRKCILGDCCKRNVTWRAF